MALDGSTSTSSASSSSKVVAQTSELPDQQQQQQPKKEQQEALHKNKSSSTPSTISTSSSADSNCNGSNMPRSPVFSSGDEEPIIMSPDLFATVRQDAQLIQAQQVVEEGEDIPPLFSFGTIHTNSTNSNQVVAQRRAESASPKFEPWKHFVIFDTSYSTSTLTRHTSTATTTTTGPEGISLMIMREIFQFLTIMQQSPLHWPGIFLRMMRLIWQGGPASYSASSLDHGAHYNTNQKWLSALSSRQQQSMRLSSSSHLPPGVHGIPNFGQTCFLNVVLQSLASLDSVLAYAEWIATEQERRQQDEDYWNLLGFDDDEDDEHLTKQQRRRRSAWRRRQKHQQPTSTVSQLLFPILQALNGQTHDKRNNRIIDPRELLWRIAQKNPQFQSNRHRLFGMTVPSSSSVSGEQQDSQEVLQALLEMMIVDAHLEDSYTLPPPPPPSTHHLYGQRSDSADVVEEKKDDTMAGGGHDVLLLGGSSHYEDDEILTVLSDRRSPRSSSNNSACSSVVSSDDDNNRKRSDSDNSVEEEMGTWNSSNKNGGRNGSSHTVEKAAWNHAHMIDSTGMISSYHSNKVNKKAGNECLAAQPNGASSVAASSMEASSLASSFLSTTSTVVTSPSASTRERQRQPQHQEGPTMSASMQIMLSTISSITKTPLSCWTGSLVQCQACRHVKAVRNQEWRDIPIVPTAVSAPMMTAARSMGGPPSKGREGAPPPPCTLEECLQDFTQVEGVEDVECANCTLQQQIQKWQDEVDLLSGAVESLERKRAKQLQQQKTNKTGNESSNNNQLDVLHVEFEEAESRLRKLQQQDPDEYEPPIHGESGDFNCDDGRPIKMLRASALKCLVLTRLPSVLCLHVQRRCYDPMTNRMSKTMQHVAFDETLDLAPYCAFGGNENARKFFNMRNNHNGNANGTSGSDRNNSSSQQHRSPILYRLASVVEHRGNAFCGHYLCYRRLPAQFSQSQQPSAASGKTHAWYYCSDDTIQEVSWNQVRTAQAYMLFYEAV